MLEDMALMRALPHMKVLVPADYASALSAIRLAAATPGPVYVRMGRASVNAVYADGAQMELGRAQLLREGADVTIVACGVEVTEALKAAEALAAQGIRAEVVDAFSVKPLDEAAILASAEKTGCVVTAEEHSVNGGLGEAVAHLLAASHPVPCEMVGMQDRFGKSGGFDELMAAFGLDAKAIEEAALRAVMRKGRLPQGS